MTLQAREELMRLGFMCRERLGHHTPSREIDPQVS